MQSKGASDGDQVGPLCLIDTEKLPACSPVRCFCRSQTQWQAWAVLSLTLSSDHAVADCHQAALELHLGPGQVAEGLPKVLEVLHAGGQEQLLRFSAMHSLPCCHVQVKQGFCIPQLHLSSNCC